MFLNPTNEQEIVQIIDIFIDKSSEDINGISMTLIKRVKDFIAKPMQYICNLSFE